MENNEMYDEQLSIQLQSNSNTDIYKSGLESESETDVTKVNVKLPGTDEDIYYGEDKWIYSSDESYSFKDVDYVYKDYVKDYVLIHKINGYSKATVNKYYIILKKITKFLTKNMILDGISITSETIDLFNQYIKKEYSSEGTRTHYRRIFKELLEKIEEKNGQDYTDLKKELSKNDRRLLKVEVERGKTPNIPKDIF